MWPGFGYEEKMDNSGQTLTDIFMGTGHENF
jgi:hypothetical protein